MHFLARHDCAGIAFPELAALVQNEQPVDHGEQRMDHVLDPDDGHTSFANGIDGRDEIFAFMWSQAASDLEPKKPVTQRFSNTVRPRKGCGI